MSVGVIDDISSLTDNNDSRSMITETPATKMSDDVHILSDMDIPTPAADDDDDASFAACKYGISSGTSGQLVSLSAETGQHRTTSYRDVKDPFAVAGLAGLRNLGNTCFMNSGLQCLLSNPRIVHYFLEELIIDETIEHTLTGKFARLLKKFWSGKFSMLHPSCFKETVGLYYPQFQDYRQHDCQEFLALLLDSLHEHLNVGKSQGKCTARIDSLDSKDDDNRVYSDDACGSGMQGLAARGVTPCTTVSGSRGGWGIDDESVRQPVVLDCTNELCSDVPTSFCYMEAKVASSVDTTKIIGNSVRCLTDATSRAVDAAVKETKHWDDSLGMDLLTTSREGEDVDDGRRRLPSVEDICMKDTKTLNTNVLALLDEVESVSTDSAKFYKPDNLHRSVSGINTTITSPTGGIGDNTRIEEEMITYDHIQDLLTCDVVTKGGDLASECKPCKDTNLVANLREKFSDDDDTSLYKKKLMFSDSLAASTIGASVVSLTTSVSGLSQAGKGDDHINNIKRIKIDETVAAAAVASNTFSSSTTDNKNQLQQAKIEQNWTTGAMATSDLKANNAAVGRNLEPVASVSSGLISCEELYASGGAVGPLGPCLNNEDHHIWDRYVLHAERAWSRYTAQNESVVVKTFQGQFKSTVICSECHHVSLTFEPFMYLSVPLPHSLERQICVTFVPCDSKQPVRYLLTISKQSTVKKLREELLKMVGDESSDIVIAEVLDHHIARVLEDNMQIKFINDTDRIIYGLDMLPPPQVDDTVAPTSAPSPEPLNDSNVTTLPNNIVSSSVQHDIIPSRPTSSGHNSTAAELLDDFFPAGASAVDGIAIIDSPLAADDDSADDIWSESLDRALNNDTHEVKCDAQDAKDRDVVLNNAYNPMISASSALGACDGNSPRGAVTSSCETCLQSNPDVDWQYNKLDNVPPTRVISNNDCSRTSVFMPDGSKLDDTSAATGDEYRSRVYGELDGSELDEEILSLRSQVDINQSGSLEHNEETADEETLGAVGGKVDQWKSCVVCLDEKVDGELMAHTSCGGTLCRPCLQLSVNYARGSYVCPVCGAAVLHLEEDFIQLNCMTNYKIKTRILSVPVLYRLDATSELTGEKTMKLFGHPNILYLQSETSGETLYETVDRIVPCYAATYSIILTDGQGYRCSRCMYNQHCSGCELAREADTLSLQPGDHLAVKFTELTTDQIEFASRVTDDRTMEGLLPQTSLTLFDCFKAFTESEVLDEHNPWYCPKCRKNQCANKTMTVWRYPDTLIVYLKRFVYHELSSTKIDNKVIFPVKDLDLSTYISGPRNDNLVYDLQSCVCHFGGANSGHYTAYARHPINGEWYYFNDETFIKQSPQDADSSSVYVLFYQRRGERIQLKVPHELSVDDETFQPSPPDLTIDSFHQMSPVDDGNTGGAGIDTYNENGSTSDIAASQLDFYS